MSEIETLSSDLREDAKPLWPVATMILAMVFAPAVIAWLITLARP